MCYFTYAVSKMYTHNPKPIDDAGDSGGGEDNGDEL